MNKLILYEDLEGNEMVLLCVDQDFYDRVFKEDDGVTIKEEIDLEEDLIAWPTNRPLSVDF